MKAIVAAVALVSAISLGAQAPAGGGQQPAGGDQAGRGRAGAGAARQTAAAPGAGSPAIYKSNAELMEILKANQARGGTTGMTSSAFSTTDQWSINVVSRDRGAGAISHAGNTELHHIIEGTATFVTGGKIVPPANGGTATIEGGVSRKVGVGDVILIPAETPHWYKDVEGKITYLEVRFVVPTK
jgi:mannose-6-phosphate isomerase-like protein (cupin superfamily)